MKADITSFHLAFSHAIVSLMFMTPISMLATPPGKRGHAGINIVEHKDVDFRLGIYKLTGNLHLYSA